MSFLAPWALVLAGVAAVPLLLHLLRRRTGARVDFPAVRYLLRAEREHAREVRLRNLLLMLVRVALVLAVALAVARPVGRLPLAGHAPTAVALLLDNSMSAGAVRNGESVLQDLARQTAAVLSAARDGDRVALVTIDGMVRAGAPAALRSALDSLAPVAGAGDGTRALARADAWLAAQGLDARAIVVLTDGQASQWPTRPDSLAAPLVVATVPGAAAGNRSVTALTVEPTAWTPRGVLRAALGGGAPAAWRVSIGETTVARGRSAADGAVELRAMAPGRGWLAGALTLESDELRGDDVRHFALYAGEPPALRVDADSPFLREAVNALVDAGRARRGSDITLGTATAARRPGLWFAPSNALALADANRALARAGIPWRFGARREGAAPLRGPGVDGARALAWYALEPSGPTDSAGVLATVGGQPWAVAGEGYVLVASPADPSGSDVFVRATFVPWVDRLLSERLGPAGGGVREVAAASELGAPDGVTALEGPDGRLREVRAGERLSAPSVAGVSFWRRGDARVGAVVVNPPAAESELAVLPLDSLASRLGAARAPSPDALARTVFSLGQRRALDSFLLSLAVLLLLAEVLLARRGRSASSVD